MKTFLPLFISAAVFTACTNTPDIGAPQSASPVADTTGYAEFAQWKNFKEQQTKTNTVYVVKHVPAATEREAEPVYTSTPASVPATNPDVPASAEPEAQPQKKGWSKAAKGAAIGAGSGAVLGAVIHKRNRVVGGVVGGAVGAGVGYGIGRHIDKKDGRY